jgi:hypothetical protein
VDGVLDRSIAADAPIDALLKHLVASRKKMGLSTGRGVRDNGPQRRHVLVRALDARREKLLGWVEASVGDVVNEGDLMLEVQAPHSLFDRSSNGGGGSGSR